jgi:hypothetical protein
VGRGSRPKPPKPGVYTNPDFTPPDVFSIAGQTGGEAIKAERADISFRQLVENIRARYGMSYRAPDSADPGQFRRIRVELSAEARRLHPHARVLARDGYYAR